MEIDDGLLLRSDEEARALLRRIGFVLTSASKETDLTLKSPRRGKAGHIDSAIYRVG